MAKLVIGSDKTVGTPAIIKEVPVYPVMETLNVTPSTSTQTILPTSPAEGFNEVDVAAVDSNIDPNILSNNIKNGVTILGITGSYTGEPPTGTITITNNGMYNVSDYANANVSVSGGGGGPQYFVPKKLERGVLLPDGANLPVLDSNVETLGLQCFAYAYAECVVSAPLIWDSTLLPNGLTLEQGALYYTFFTATFTYTDIDLSAITEANGLACLQNTFEYSNITSLDLSGLREISVGLSGYNGAGQYMCAYCNTLESVDISNIEHIGNYGFSNAFRDCPLLASAISLQHLTIVENYGLNNAFNGSSIPTFSIPNVTNIGTYALQNVCQNDTALTTVDISGISCVPNNGMSGAFSGCSNLLSADVSNISQLGESQGMALAFANTGITVLRFNNLKSIYRSAFGSGTSTYSGGGAFLNLNIELHFPANMQADIEATSGYSNRWGAASADIYYDLPDTYLLESANGQILYRFPYFDTADSLGWFISGQPGTVYYTSGTSTPEVGNDIYEDPECSTWYDMILDVR